MNGSIDDKVSVELSTQEASRLFQALRYSTRHSGTAKRLHEALAKYHKERKELRERMPLLIGLTGGAGSGKDTLADQLVRKYGYAKLTFAAPIKNTLCSLFGWSPNQWEDREWKEKIIPEIGHSPRQLAQTLGTEWGRKHYPDIWLNQLKELHAKFASPVVISDVRFDNEANWVRANGGSVIHIYRPTALVAESTKAHVSEKGVTFEPSDRAIVNNSDVIDFLQRAERMLFSPRMHEAKPHEWDAVAQFLQQTGA